MPSYRDERLALRTPDLGSDQRSDIGRSRASDLHTSHHGYSTDGQTSPTSHHHRTDFDFFSSNKKRLLLILARIVHCWKPTKPPTSSSRGLSTHFFFCSLQIKTLLPIATLLGCLFYLCCCCSQPKELVHHAGLQLQKDAPRADVDGDDRHCAHENAA